MTRLPTWETIRTNARYHLAEARDWLHSDWAPGTVLTDEQAEGRREALRLIGEAKAALEKAGRR
jgi:hypothetical protein